MTLEEADYILTVLKSVDVRHVLEVGGGGGAARLWRDELHPDLLISVNGDEGINEEGIEYVRGRPSHDPLTQEVVRGLLAGRKLDFLFIGGGDTVEVRASCRAYIPRVRRGGIVAMHDIDVCDEERDIRSLWKLLADDDGIITTEFHDATGVGIVWKE